MPEQPIGPRCGNNPNVRLTPGDRKAVEDFKGRLALQAAAKPYIDRAVWVDGDPLMEVIASAVWERCSRDDEDMPQLVCDDPRTIAAFAAAVARAHAAAVPSAPADRAARAKRYGQVLRHWGLLDEVNDPKSTEEFAVADLLAIADAQQAGQVADRAAIYREVADRLAADAEQGAKEGFTRIYRRSAAKQVREWADEAQQPAADPSWPRRAWNLGLLHKGGDAHHCPACLKQPEPPANFVCPGDNTEVLANPQPVEEA